MNVVALTSAQNLLNAIINQADMHVFAIRDTKEMDMNVSELKITKLRHRIIRSNRQFVVNAQKMDIALKEFVLVVQASLEMDMIVVQSVH
jgi:hypothetical protein